VTAANDAEVAYTYDDFGRRVAERSADRGELRYEYDAADNLISKTDARGATTRFDYDGDNRPIKAKDREGSSRFTYRGSQLVAISSTHASDRFEYDADGQVISHVRLIGAAQFTTRYEYDAAGHLQSQTSPSGEQLLYSRDARGNVRALARNSLVASSLIASASEKATALSPLSNLEFGNGIDLTDTYDERTGALRRRSSPGVIGLEYSYDELGRIQSIERDDDIRAFEYDALGRLTDARNRDHTFSYDYDANGNRISGATTPNARQSRRYTTPALLYLNESNRLAEAPTKERPAYEYDTAGNPIRIGERHYEYDSTGRPIHLYVHDKLVATYRYDALGQRVSKTLYRSKQPVTTFYLYENQQLAAEADQHGRITREYIYLDRHPIAMLERGAVYWIHTDHLGTPLAVTDQNRKVIWRADYEPFGKAHVTEDPDRDGVNLTLNLRFPGQYADAESGTHYNLMRDYDPETGRYLTPDRLGLFDGTNQYAYAHSNPISGSDPLGLYDAYVHFYMTYFLALVAGLPSEVAERIATAAQYIDENPLTSPIAGAVNGSLSKYHFVLDYDLNQHGDGNSDPILRMLNPSSSQLTRLHDFAELGTLERLWAEAHPTGIPGTCALPDRTEVRNARYQLYGEYLHAYEDTFAHRDTLNNPYDVYSFNDENEPHAIIGHVGPNVPDDSHAPDHSFNQVYPEKSKCRKRLPVPRSGFRYETVIGLTVWECSSIGGEFTPPKESAWQYNELRTLRMEWKVFGRFTEDFAEEIESHKQQGGRAFSWSDLAGTDRFLPSSARIGTADDLPIQAVLQRFNAAPDSEKLQILNDWLREHGVEAKIPSLDGDHLSNLDQAARTRRQVLGWIPQHAARDFNVLLPAARPSRGR
jgi:RHS repeat-associated protein